MQKQLSERKSIAEVQGSPMQNCHKPRAKAAAKREAKGKKAKAKQQPKQPAKRKQQVKMARAQLSAQQQTITPLKKKPCAREQTPDKPNEKSDAQTMQTRTEKV